MTARVLVVDDLPQNVKLLEVKLTAEYYDVFTASSGRQALQVAKEQHPDIILLDVMMPEMDGYETCRRIREDTELSHIPVVMVTALSEVEDRVRGLEAGADDFLTKPPNDTALFARIRSLTRLKMMMDELRLRNQTGSEFGLIDIDVNQNEKSIDTGKILLIDDDVIQSKELSERMKRPKNTVDVLINPEKAQEVATEGNYDLIIVSTQMLEMDGLRLCSHLRSQEATRQTPLLILIEEEDKQIMVKGLDMGVNDYVIVPVDNNELIARVNTQIRRKRYQDALKSNYQKSVSMAVTDGLTNLYNRRYFDTHFKKMVQASFDQGKPLSVMMLDIDHFKQVNDVHGHQSGDDILQQVAARLDEAVRNTDLVARYGGEEFVIIANGTNLNEAKEVAERIRNAIASRPMNITGKDGNPGELSVTLSIGVSTLFNGDTDVMLLSRADKALYHAKESGRNRVVTG